MKSVGRGMQWGWGVVVVSVLCATCAVTAHAWEQNEVESDLLLKLATSSSSSSDIYKEGPLEVDLFTVYSTGLSGLHHHNCHQHNRHLHLQHKHETHDQNHHHSWRKHGPTFVEVKLAANEEQPPLPLLIASPKEAGDYPVIMFQHGFSMRNTFYSQLMQHVASHGFVVVAPQMYNYYSGSDVTSEICSAASVIDWMPAGLSQVLSKRAAASASVKPDLSKLALVGHSRGGKVVFGLATGVCKKASLKLSAIAGLDPVDGMSASQQTLPPILQFSEHALKLDMPTLIVGSGLGPQGKWFFPACAPEGVSHAAFYNESDAPAFHFVAPEHGHMDFMDDFTAGVQGFLSYWTCKNGPGREPMRRFAGGILVAFFRAALLEDNSQLSAAFSETSQAPVKLEKPESYGSL